MDFDRGIVIAGRRIDPILAALLFILIVSAVFLVVPQLDVWFTLLFYDPQIGFPAAHVPLLRALRQLNNLVIAITVGAILASTVLKLALPDRPSLIRPQWSTYILTTLLVGTVLVVNGIFKTFSGRPRPTRVDAFGGGDAFVPAWHLYGPCPRNCSFISGEGFVGLLGVRNLDARAAGTPPRNAGSGDRLRRGDIDQPRRLWRAFPVGRVAELGGDGADHRRGLSLPDPECHPTGSAMNGRKRG